MKKEAADISKNAINALLVAAWKIAPHPLLKAAAVLLGFAAHISVDMHTKPEGPVPAPAPGPSKPKDSVVDAEVVP